MIYDSKEKLGYGIFKIQNTVNIIDTRQSIIHKPF